MPLLFCVTEANALTSSTIDDPAASRESTQFDRLLSVKGLGVVCADTSVASPATHAAAWSAASPCNAAKTKTLCKGAAKGKENACHADEEQDNEKRARANACSRLSGWKDAW